MPAATSVKFFKRLTSDDNCKILTNVSLILLIESGSLLSLAINNFAKFIHIFCALLTSWHSKLQVVSSAGLKIREKHCKYLPLAGSSSLSYRFEYLCSKNL
jgi:hypothetical protein